MPPLLHHRPSLDCACLISGAFALAMGLSAQVQAQSAEAAADKTANKLTLGIYRISETGNAADITLRHTNDFGNTWLGYYQSSARDERQARAGWDNTFEIGAVRVTPSAQIASYGYLNGSVNVETGDTWFVGAGFGRTNLKPNWNLNFDPNDAWTVSLGRRTNTETMTLLWVRDNRENPDQRHIHGVYRRPLPNGQRITLDILHKRGLVEGEPVRRTGATLTYDWPQFFLRLAFDPKVNFTNEDMWRFSFGTRF